MKRFILLSLVLFTTCCAAFAQQDDPDYTGMWLTMTLNEIRAYNLPESIRFVPNHRDDGYASPTSAGPITKLNYAIKDTITVSRPLDEHGITIGGLRFLLEAGWIINLSANEGVITALGDFGQRNYTNAVGTHQRGEGAALTFVGIQERCIPSLGFFDTITNIYPSVSAEYSFGPKDNAWGLINCNVAYWRLIAVTGWDRNNYHALRKTYTLAQCLPVTLTFAYRGWGLGCRYVVFKPTMKGSGVEIKSAPTFSFSREWQ